MSKPFIMKATLTAVNTLVLFFLLFSPSVTLAQDSVEDKMITAAAKGEYSKVVNLVEKKGANVNAKNKARWTALAYAAKYNHIEIVKFLVEKNADVNKKINTGETALQVALKRGNEEVSDFLIENGADLNIKDIVGMTALAWAAKDGNMKMLTYLIDKGADINSQNPSGRTPYEIAMSPEVKEFLREKGAKTGKELLAEKGY